MKEKDLSNHVASENSSSEDRHFKEAVYCPACAEIMKKPYESCFNCGYDSKTENH